MSAESEAICYNSEENGLWNQQNLGLNLSSATLQLCDLGDSKLISPNFSVLIYKTGLYFKVSS